jgi:hypothetical protein
VTAIVGLVSRGRVWLGGDSALSDDGGVFLTRDPKVFQRSDGVVAAFCGTLRYGQLLALTVLPKRGPNLDLWVRQDVTKALRQAARDMGFELGQATDQDDSEGLLGVDGELYSLSPGAIAWRPSLPYCALGSGGPWAAGNMHRSTGRPRERITKALEAAALHSAGVRAPWSFAET